MVRGMDDTEAPADSEVGADELKLGVTLGLPAEEAVGDTDNEMEEETELESPRDRDMEEDAVEDAARLKEADEVGEKVGDPEKDTVSVEVLESDFGGRLSETDAVPEKDWDIESDCRKE